MSLQSSRARQTQSSRNGEMFSVKNQDLGFGQ
jgi:hypothetical protein